jgi:hypothetical protein
MVPLFWLGHLSTRTIVLERAADADYSCLHVYLINSTFNVAYADRRFPAGKRHYRP